MKVIGIDQASHTGYAVVLDGEIIRSGTVVFSGDIGKRLSAFSVWLRDIIKTELPDLVVYERPHFRGYAATISGVSMIAVIQMIAYEVAVRTFGVHTATLKKFATGYGRAGKAEMTAAANADDSSLHLKTKENNDEADAIHLAMYGSTVDLNADNENVRARPRHKRANK